jgi:hypothetical protein
MEEKKTEYFSLPAIIHSWMLRVIGHRHTHLFMQAG